MQCSGSPLVQCPGSPVWHRLSGRPCWMTLSCLTFWGQPLFFLCFFFFNCANFQPFDSVRNLSVYTFFHVLSMVCPLPLHYLLKDSSYLLNDFPSLLIPSSYLWVGGQGVGASVVGSSLTPPVQSAMLDDIIVPHFWGHPLGFSKICLNF